MDVLSSQAAVAGYECALIAADHSPKFFPMLTYAAGTIRPAKVLVIGAGVAGLQAIATAKRLGAMVSGYDVRPETKEQIESLGAKFVDTGVSAAGAGGYARELTDEEKRSRPTSSAGHRRVRRADHHRRDPRQEGAGDRHRRDGGAHEAGLGGRRHGGRERRQRGRHPGR
jgi:NAD/NADP transhydrogenase alpha subunit